MSAESTIETSMRARLLALQNQLRERVDRLHADKRREPEPLSADSADRAVQRENDDVVDSIELAAEAELQEIDGALRRIEAGKYGECESCGARIETKRLAAVPYAQRCQNCATAS